MQTITLHLRAEDAAPIPTSVRPLALTSARRQRSRQRIVLADDSDLAIALTPGTVLKPGDHLQTAAGEWFEIVAEPEPVLCVRATEPRVLVAAAYHLGNRHVPVQVFADRLLLAPDAVLAVMLQGLGARVEELMLPFEPERGAYGGGHRHGHQDSFSEDYALAQAGFRAHARAPFQSQASAEASDAEPPPVKPLFGADSDA